jgi:hypothetical protein
MRVAEVRPFADFPVLSVMQEAEERLEQEEADNDRAEGGVGFVKELKGSDASARFLVWYSGSRMESEIP